MVLNIYLLLKSSLSHLCKPFMKVQLDLALHLCLLMTYKFRKCRSVPKGPVFSLFSLMLSCTNTNLPSLQPHHWNLHYGDFIFRVSPGCKFKCSYLGPTHFIFYQHPSPLHDYLGPTRLFFGVNFSPCTFIRAYTLIFPPLFCPPAWLLGTTRLLGTPE